MRPPFYFAAKVHSRFRRDVISLRSGNMLRNNGLRGNSAFPGKVAIGFPSGHATKHSRSGAHACRFR
ncbi:hypothetical protein AGR13a_Cc340074 [Agrobacterium genomosp. 13 str. CFBP 6927]|uniref:DUF4236 domain-containing protein n=1 Tax=Agrobacterium genomosp. 13 str. CFBP 6927 TaxID=1183428 RepID=A0ABP2BL34_9HYPH|nr:hypothetical protein AGR13a_Cc340074 [Agrobacterium genomosp. 13 str. CFBP 6927]